MILLKTHNNAQHSLPLVAGTPNRWRVFVARVRGVMFLGELRMRCFVFLYLLSFASYGSSCVQSDEQVAAWSSKYAHLFDVSAQIINNSFSVYVDLPVTIEERALHTVWVVVGDPNAPLIALPTTVFEEDRKTRARFVAKPIDNEEYKFIFSYGAGCSISIEVPVEFKEKA